MPKNANQKEPDNQLDQKIQDKSPAAKQEQMTSWFEKLTWLELSGEEKEEVSTKIGEDIDSNGLYWTELTLSSIIATFGLLQNSVAVIIGAMLIAPLLKPIQGIAFGIANGRSKTIWRSAKLLINSVLVAILVAWIFSVLTPLRTETSEILARTSPNILDFFVAIASGILALLSLSYKKLSSSIAGVAMSASLLPPLAVIGIQFSLWNLDLAWSSSLLFITNLLAILIVGVPIFIFYGFYPHQINNQKVALRDTFILIVGIGIITVPLFGSLLQINERIQLQQTAEKTVRESLLSSLPDARLEELILEDFTDTSARLSSTIRIPESQEFFTETREIIREELGKQLKRETTLDLQIIPIASIISQKELEQQLQTPFQGQAKNELRDIIQKSELETTIISMDIAEVESEDNDTQMQWAINTVFTLPNGSIFSEKDKENLEKQLQEQYPKESFSFFWTPIAQREIQKEGTQESELENLRREKTLKWQSFLSQTVPSSAKVENLNVSWESEQDTSNELAISKYLIDFDIYIPTTEETSIQNLDRQIQRFSRRNFDLLTETNYRVFTYDQVKTLSLPPNTLRINGENQDEEIPEPETNN